MAGLYYKITPTDVAKLYYSQTPEQYISIFDHDEQTGGHGPGPYFRGMYVSDFVKSLQQFRNHCVFRDKLVMVSWVIFSPRGYFLF